MHVNTLHEKASYLRDAIFSASDGIVTTFAIVAGSTGASLTSNVVIVLGFANLVADGISMASATYLGVKSETDYEKAEGDTPSGGASALKQGIVTFFAFDIAGISPLIPYIFGFPNPFLSSIIVMAITLFIIGLGRAYFTKKGALVSGLETLLIGGLAAGAAYLTGYVIERFS